MTILSILSKDEILKQALKKVLSENRVENLLELLKQKGISSIVVKVEKEAHQIYRLEEKKSVIDYFIKQGLAHELSKDIASKILDTGLVTAIANTRRARAGSTSESILRLMLEAMEIPCEKGVVSIGGYRPDVVVPSNKILESGQGIAISVKRTLRERWAEDIDVFKFPNGKFVLITPDPDFKEDKVKDMISRGMKKVYIPDELYEQSSDFVGKYPQFRKLSLLPDDIKSEIRE